MKDYDDTLKEAIARMPKSSVAKKEKLLEPGKKPTNPLFGYYILDKNGINPIEVDSDAWLEWQVANRYEGVSRVSASMARSPVSNREFYVSTVFLPVFHGTSPEWEPILWETMVFDSNGKEAAVNEVYCGRCAGTRADAERMHRITTAAVQSGAIPSPGTL